MDENIFLSYAWNDTCNNDSEKLVDEVAEILINEGFNVVLDKKDLEYKGSIIEFEKRLGRSNKIIIFVSDRYLKSEHCMLEFLFIKQNKNVRDRIFPIILSSANIYNEIDRIDYINYWDKKIEDLNLKIKTIKNPIGITSVINKVDQYNDIRRIFADITDMLRDMNSFTLEILRSNDWEILKNSIKSQVKEKKVIEITPDEWSNNWINKISNIFKQK